MLGLQLFILGIILLVIPVLVGTLFIRTDRGTESLPFIWVSGQIALWAGFQLLSIPLILLQKSFSLTVNCYCILMGGLTVLALLLLAVKIIQANESSNASGSEPGNVTGKAGKKHISQWILWGIFVLLLLLQLVLTVVMSYEEGDDAFYVSISTITEASDTMYRVLPYTGTSTGLDARHGLAPFPVWVAFLARLSGMPAVTVAQVALPVVLICMAYSIYYLLADRLFKENRKNIPFFLILAELMVLFGGYSTFSAENFLLVRASQGKAVVANIIIPFLLYLLLVLLEKMNHNKVAGWLLWLLLALTMTAGCLCSTLGTLLTCMLVGIVGLCAAVCYGRWKMLFPMVSCCTVPVIMALLYFVLE